MRRLTNKGKYKDRKISAPKYDIKPSNHEMRGLQTQTTGDAFVIKRPAT